MNTQIIRSHDAPAPMGHYSQGILSRGVLYVSGQLPLDVDLRLPEGVEVQARQVLRNVIAIVEAAGGTRESIVQMQIFIPDISHWPLVNKVYEEMLGSHKPARTVVPTKELHLGALVEVNAIAHIG